MPTFLHPALLGGLLLAGVPVLIHLINLMHRRRVRWAAMEFLLASERKNRAWIRLKELLLLAARMLAIALVVLIVAQPLVRGELGALVGRMKTHHVVLLDDSFSMSDRYDGANVMDRAKAVVDRIAAMAAERVDPQSFTLLRLSRAGRRTEPDVLNEPVDGEFVRRLRARLGAMGSSQSAAGPGGAIRAVSQLLGDADDQSRIVYLVSDFRAKDWGRAEELRALLAGLAAKNVAIRLVNCADQARPNLAVTRLAPVSGTRAVGTSILMEVEVRNFSATTARDVPVLLEEEGHVRPAVKIREIPPGGAARERFQVSFATAGLHRLAARLDGDAIQVDNIRYAVVDVALAVPVLVVDGSAEGQGALFLSSALSPGGTVRTGIQPRQETPAFLGLHSLEDYQVVYLSDVEHLDAAAVDTLARYVAGGGGLALFVGPRTRAGFMNASLWRDGEGLLPLPLAGEKRLPLDRLENVPDVTVGNHPIFRVLSGKDNSFLATIGVRRYFGVPAEWKPGPDSTTRVIARLRNGAPLVAERPFGKGRVIVWLSTAAPIWNNAAANPSFPVLIQEMQAHLARRSDVAGSQQVGAPLELKLNPRRYRPTVRFLSPDKDAPGPTLGEQTAAKDGSLVVRFARTDTAGVYEARLVSTTGTPQTRRWAVNVDPREGDLARLDAAQLSDRLHGVKYTYHQSDAFEADQPELAGHDLSDVLLGVLVVLLVGEQFLAWSCSYHPRPNVAVASRGRGGAP